MLGKHKFQFNSFHYCYHGEKTSGFHHFNQDSHLIHVVRGTGKIIIDGAEFRMRAGDVYSIPPLVDFIMYIDADFLMMNIHYQIWLEDGEPLSKNYHLPIHFRPAGFSRIKEKLLKIYQLNDDYSTRPLIAYELILSYFSANKPVQHEVSGIDERIQRLQQRLESRECRQFNAEKMAKFCALSKSQMNRKFRQYFKTSPHHYWDRRRFFFVCSELRTSGRSISEIATRFDFEDVAYFSRWFKKMALRSPLEYRNRFQFEDYQL